MDHPSQDNEPYTISLQKCRLIGSRIIVRGGVEKLPIKEAIALLAPSKNKSDVTKVLKVKTGYFIGTLSRQPNIVRNFIIVNPTNDGDVRWLLRKNNGFEKALKEIYKVVDVSIPKEAYDVTGDPEKA